MQRHNVETAIGYLCLVLVSYRQYSSKAFWTRTIPGRCENIKKIEVNINGRKFSTRDTDFAVLTVMALYVKRVQS